MDSGNFPTQPSGRDSARGSASGEGAASALWHLRRQQQEVQPEARNDLLGSGQEVSPQALRAEIDRARAAEASALAQARELRQAAASRQDVAAAVERSLQFRREKNRLVQRLITAVEREPQRRDRIE